MPFKLTGYCRLRSKEENSSQETFMALQSQMESSQQRQMRLQDISAGKAICSQLETLEKRAIIYSCDRQHFITLLMLVLNFAF